MPTQPSILHLRFTAAPAHSGGGRCVEIPAVPRSPFAAALRAGCLSRPRPGEGRHPCTKQAHCPPPI